MAKERKENKIHVHHYLPIIDHFLNRPDTRADVNKKDIGEIKNAPKIGALIRFQDKFVDNIKL
ncbi:TPA: hypothetical protein GHF72_08525 [Providencia stuartii]|uniref:Uncharacterized protein n=2 Tax=Providencia stuartii TaxID=588 RepID=A0AA87CSG2_PROST|nr:hypothetical protein S70_05780 [Providencia stuartii MRSN 2154]AMG68541.1 hypothetical protein AL507_18980 [Providencia stuartii]EDU61199.1 hypothetical protein PROSTU_00787 [Providencia stuartii ATCC 25827]GHC04884.1 hypothetical protein GCM10007290_37080 [Providencia thailandensis]APG51000.1 hypothetical protein BGK56_08600 [Providencia stuartii]